uniref:Large ribosomal subunit protein uL29m n=1 Tax=Meleagris gallopavo TaxID=9103 RepID=A0A803Y9F9_MELGA
MMNILFPWPLLYRTGAESRTEARTLIPSVSAPGRGQQRSPRYDLGTSPARSPLAATVGGPTPARFTSRPPVPAPRVTFPSAPQGHLPPNAPHPTFLQPPRPYRQCRFTLKRCHESLAQAEPFCHARFLHTTLPRKGLEEFFDDPKNWGEKTVKSGDAWNIKQLRAKSSQDLHKLWYVLLKEKNMLLTLEQESKRQQKPMPSPERLEKVQKSMKNIDLVVREREIALRLLQTGHEKPVPGEWRNDFLGRTYWYSYKEWPIPWYLNKKYKKRKFYYLPHVNRFIRLRLEKYLRLRNRRQNLEKKKQKLLEKKFPHLAVKSQSQ